MTARELDALNRDRVAARLLSATVHDVRNALQGISGAAELLSFGPQTLGPDQLAQRAGQILRQTAWLGERLDRLLQITADLPPQADRLDVGRVVSHALSLRQATWARQQITAAATVVAGLAVRADLTHTVRILVNLLLNAEYSLRMRGGGTIAISAEIRETTVVLVVEDSGPGVTPLAEAHVFTPRTETGLLATGLPASRNLAEAMGGALGWLGPERRAAFELRLPSGG